jgi:hypothetical protein
MSDCEDVDVITDDDVQRYGKRFTFAERMSGSYRMGKRVGVAAICASVSSTAAMKRMPRPG